ncbi:MAG: hypothetical protein R3Y65_04205 [Bacillota bacterium]
MKIDMKLYSRYETVLKNIRAGSNSFYDSYLDMQETFVKFVVDCEEIEYRSNETCGGILRLSKVEELFISQIGMDKAMYNKMINYSKKVNDHKHKNEKMAQADGIVLYMSAFYNNVKLYAINQNIDIEQEFSTEYFIGEFKKFEKEKIVLEKEFSAIRDELEKSIESNNLSKNDIEEYNALLDISRASVNSIEEENYKLQVKISKMKDIRQNVLEEKLNKALELLLNLNKSVVENRAITYAVGDSICGREMFNEFIQSAKEEIEKE